MKNNLPSVKTFTILLVFAYILIAKNASAQSTNYDRNSPAFKLLERLEIKSGNLNNGLFLDAAPVTRDNAREFINRNFYSLTDTNERLLLLRIDNITKTDNYWNAYIYNDNIKYIPINENDSIYKKVPYTILGYSKKPILRHFYKTKANLLEAHTNDFDVYINPVLGFEIGKQQDFDKQIFRNTRGFEIRGQISHKLGFYTYFTENQAGFPTYIQNYIRKNGAVPDVGLWKPFKKNYYDFLNSRGYITFSPIKNIHMQFGNDKNFIGSGFRSMLLSDFAKDYLQLKITTRVWRFQYQNIFAEMTNYQGNGNKNVPYPKKYAAMHYLSFDAARWFNIGVFEGIMFYDNKNNGRGFDLNYLNPIIFYRSVEHNLGSPDNALLGTNLNFLVAKRVKLYGQLLLDEFVLNEYRHNQNWWANKYGVQAGFKWIDFLGLPNVDIQSEFNVVRPYTYSSDTVAKAFEHFKQPLAHPMGSNLREMVNILRINTFGPLDIQLKYIITQQGLDTGKVNLGSIIFLNNRTRYRDYGNDLLQGLKTTTTFAELTASYMLRHNLFIDADILYRTQKNDLVSDKIMYYGLGVRLNFTKPDYTF